MVWYQTFDSTFWITISTIVTATIGLAVKMCVKSKCSTFRCFGIECIRDTRAELEEHEFDVEHARHSPSTDSA